MPGLATPSDATTSLAESGRTPEVPTRQPRVPTGTLPAAGRVAVTAQGPSGGPDSSQAPRSHRHLQISAAIPEPTAGTACLPPSCGICCLLITGGDPTAPPRESTEAYRNRHRTRPRPASASRQPRPARPWLTTLPCVSAAVQLILSAHSDRAGRQATSAPDRPVTAAASPYLDTQITPVSTVDLVDGLGRRRARSGSDAAAGARLDK